MADQDPPAPSSDRDRNRARPENGPKKRGGPKGVNWIAVRTAYVVEGLTQEQCADRFGLAPATVGRRAAKEHWSEERQKNVIRSDAIANEAATEQAREVVREQIESHREAVIETVRAELDTLALGSRIAQRLARAADGLLATYLCEEGAITPGITPGERQNEADVLNALADAVKKSILVGREISGLRTGQSNEKIGSEAAPLRRFVFVRPKALAEPITDEQAAS